MNKGMIGMICGIVSIALSILAYVFPAAGLVLILIALAAAILGIVFGVKGRKDEANKGMGTAGLVTGIIGVVFAGITVAITVACVGCAACAICAAGSAVNDLAQYANSLY